MSAFAETKNLVCAVLVLTLVVCSQIERIVRASQHEASPRIQFETRVYNFGFTGQNRKIKYQFTFSNAGRTPLLVKAVKASCGCLVSLTPSTSFGPGAKGAIDVVCETGRRIGQLSETVHVQSNDPEEPEITLKILGYVRADFALDPESLRVGAVEKGMPTLKVLKLVDLTDGTLDLKRVEVSEKYFATNVQKFEDSPMRGFLIQIALKPNAPVGPFALPLTLHTNLPRHPRIDVPITGHVLGDVRFDRLAMSLGRVKRGEAVKQSLKIVSSNGVPFHVSRLASDPPFLLAKTRPVRARSQYELSLQISDQAPTGPFSGTLTAYTDAAEQPFAILPVYGLVTEGDLIAVSAKAEGVSGSPTKRGTVYATRIPVEEDTYVSAWLIKRFLDPSASFSFVDTDSIPTNETVVLFDLPDPRARWRRTHRACAAEHILTEVEKPDLAAKTIVEHVRKLERASWLVSPHSEAGRLRTQIMKMNKEVPVPAERVLAVFRLLDQIHKAKGKVPR